MGSTAGLVARTALVIGSAAVVQIGLFSQLPVAGVRVPALLVVAVAAGLALGASRGAVVGFAAGLTFDLLLTTPLGLCAGVFAVAAYLAARFEPPRNDVWWRLPATAAVAGAATYLTVVVVGWLLARRPAAPDHLVTVVLVVGAVSGAVAPVAVRLLRWAAVGPPRDVPGVGTSRGR